MGEAVGGILGAGPKIVTGFLEKDAAKEAYRKQREGLKTQQRLLKEDYDPDRINTLVNKYDKSFLLKRRELQSEVDPELAELRQRGKEQLLAQFQTPESARRSTQAAEQLFRENINPDASSERLRQKILSTAESELDAGATLPPEFQAELVRSGLESGGASGVGLARRTIGGNVSRLLGSGGVALQQSRQNQAMNLANTGQSMANARFDILSKIFPTVSAQEGQTAQRAGAAFALGDSTAPSGGLTGREVMGLDITGREGKRNLTQQRADLSAKNTLTQARFLNNIIGTAASMGGALYDGGQVDPYTGAAAAGGGGGGGGGSLLGGGGGGGGGGSLGSIVGLLGMFSDVNAKENIEVLDREGRDAILDKVLKLPVSTWNYKPDALPDQSKHIGPMAQDFAEAFGMGDTDRMIAGVDANGVLLASVQALAAKVLELEQKAV